MSTSHLSPEEAERFVFGRLDTAGYDRALRHLIGCKGCKALLAPYLSVLLEEEPVDVPAAEPEGYDEAVTRAFLHVQAKVPCCEKERERIPKLLAVLLAVPTDSRGFPLIAKIRPPLRSSWALVEALLAASHEMRFKNQRTMLDFAFMARAAAGNLSRSKYPPAFLADVEARACGELANAWRLNDSFEMAEVGFSAADELLDQGTGDPLVLARLLDLQSSLRSSQRRLPEAIELLDHAERHYREAGDTHLVGRVLIKKGINTHYEGRPAEAVRLLRHGIAQVEPARDAKLVSMGQESLLHALVDCGALTEAAELLLQSGLRQAFAAEPINLLRLRWVEGKIFNGQKKLRRAEAIFQEVREGFFAQAMHYDAALVGLELAGVWLQQGGQTAAVRSLAEEARETFEDLAVHGEALRAIRYFQRACEEDLATAALVHQLVTFLRRLEWDPQLRFAP